MFFVVLKIWNEANDKFGEDFWFKFMNDCENKMWFWFLILTYDLSFETFVSR